MYVGIDLGSTNIKAAAYDQNMRLVSSCSLPVTYIRDGVYIEFDAEKYFDDIVSLLADVCGRACTDPGHPRAGGSDTGTADPICHIALTGQAETLICLDADGRPLANAISWMDERSADECALLSERFTTDQIRSATGQAAVLPTWPATKILWLRSHRPDIFERTAHFVLLKDYVAFRLCGRLAADMSIATFSLYFDIYKKEYWRGMLDAIGIDESLLPELTEPCTCLGRILADIAIRTGISPDSTVNTGTLDHFAGMIGTGNTAPGGVTLSIGTVMALAAMRSEPRPENNVIADHYGFLPDTHVLLPVAESGGVSLEWLRRTCMEGVSYEEINSVLAQRGPSDIIFLPYIVGTSAPEFDSRATGVFWGLRQEHDKYDMARAVMEGVAFVLRKNCEAIEKAGTRLDSIIITGGGAKSPVWCQIIADVSGLPVRVPLESEAACLGAAMIASVADGRFASYAEAAAGCVSYRAVFTPMEDRSAKYRRFCSLYDACLDIQ